MKRKWLPDDKTARKGEPCQPEQHSSPAVSCSRLPAVTHNAFVSRHIRLGRKKSLHHFIQTIFITFCAQQLKSHFLQRNNKQIQISSSNQNVSWNSFELEDQTDKPENFAF